MKRRYKSNSSKISCLGAIIGAVSGALTMKYFLKYRRKKLIDDLINTEMMFMLFDDSEGNSNETANE